jgi:hypothetical protein
MHRPQAQARDLTQQRALWQQEAREAQKTLAQAEARAELELQRASAAEAQVRARWRDLGEGVDTVRRWLYANDLRTRENLSDNPTPQANTARRELEELQVAAA